MATRNGSGILICSGGWRLPMTWANIALLRAYGTTLPVEVWHLRGEVTRAGQDLLRLVGARARQLPKFGEREGYFNVPFALAETSFAQVLILDSDFTPLPASEVSSLLQHQAFLNQGALLAPDLLDLRARDFYPAAWHRLGIEAPTCPSAARCPAAFGTDSAVMALDLERCPGAPAALRALAAEAADTGRYGWAGDKELYQLAWQAAGCKAPAVLPYPSLLGHASTPLGFFVGIAMAHHHPGDSAPMGIHWAWSKALLHGEVPALPELQQPPAGGYADPAEHHVNHPEEHAKRIFEASGEVREHFYVLSLASCFESDGRSVPCSTRPLQLHTALSDFSSVLSFARWALHKCTDGGPVGARCPLRQRLPPGSRARIRPQWRMQ